MFFTFFIIPTDATDRKERERGGEKKRERGGERERERRVIRLFLGDLSQTRSLGRFADTNYPYGSYTKMWPRLHVAKVVTLVNNSVLKLASFCKTSTNDVIPVPLRGKSWIEFNFVARWKLYIYYFRASETLSGYRDNFLRTASVAIFCVQELLPDWQICGKGVRKR